jgi:hypothetical protein
LVGRTPAEREPKDQFCRSQSQSAADVMILRDEPAVLLSKADYIEATIWSAHPEHPGWAMPIEPISDEKARRGKPSGFFADGLTSTIARSVLSAPLRIRKNVVRSFVSERTLTASF